MNNNTTVQVTVNSTHLSTEERTKIENFITNVITTNNVRLHRKECITVPSYLIDDTISRDIDSNDYEYETLTVISIIHNFDMPDCPILYVFK